MARLASTRLFTDLDLPSSRLRHLGPVSRGVSPSAADNRVSGETFHAFERPKYPMERGNWVVRILFTSLQLIGASVYFHVYFPDVAARGFFE